MSSVLINGPINVVRLEGRVNNVKKILYIFMDVHINIQHQTQCTNPNSINIKQYINQTFKNLDKNKEYDFFMEITGTHIETNKVLPFRTTYIGEMANYFKTFCKDKCLQKNIRFHYVDIRDFLKMNINDIIRDSNSITKDFAHKNIINKNNYNKLIQNMKSLHNTITEIYLLIFKDDKNMRNLKRQTKVYSVSENKKYNISIMKKFINKITSAYHNMEIYKQFGVLFTIIETRFKQIIKLIDQTLVLLNSSKGIILKSTNILTKHDTEILSYYNYGKDTLKTLDFKHKLQKLLFEIEISTSHTFAMITDIFFMRRFLDKDYITNGIVYTGAMHSITYIYTLIKYFNFKLTHSSYTLINHEQIMDTIKKNKFNEQIMKLFMPRTLIQCSDMTKFPKNFL